jgi:hypothetical protein
MNYSGISIGVSGLATTFQHSTFSIFAMYRFPGLSSLDSQSTKEDTLRNCASKMPQIIPFTAGGRDGW